MNPRVVTGLGIASAAGVGAEAFFAAMRAPARLSSRPPSPITCFDASAYEAEGARLPAVEVPGFEPKVHLGDKGLRTLDRLTKLLIVAARLCLHDAGLKKDKAWAALGPDAVGVCCSNAYGSLEAITELDRVAKLEDARYINPAKFPNTVSNSASGYVSIWEELRALNVSVSDGNCGGLDAVGCADVFLETGRASAILTGGGEAMSEALFLAFRKLGALRGAEAERATHLGEAAVFFSLETREGARARSAKALGEITGYGTAFVAPDDEATLIFASREALRRAIAQALADADVAAKDVDVVASSVSGIARFDDEELAAIEAELGSAVAVAAPKLALGETLGAGGAVGVASALAWLSSDGADGAQGAVPGPLVRGEPPRDVRTVLVTSVGYYGNASAVVVRRPA